MFRKDESIDSAVSSPNDEFALSLRRSEHSLILRKHLNPRHPTEVSVISYDFADAGGLGSFQKEEVITIDWFRLESLKCVMDHRVIQVSLD